MNIEQRKQLHKDFWQGKGRSLILIPTPQLKPYPSNMDNYKERFYSPRKMWEFESEQAQSVIQWPTDGLPTIRPNLGTIFIPAIAGQNYIMQDGQMPWPGRHFSFAQISAIKSLDIDAADIMKLAKHFYEIHKDKGSKEIFSYLPDTQGVFDILHLLRGDDIFYEMADKKQLIKELFNIVTDFYIEVSKKLKNAIGEDNCSMVHGHATPQGVFCPDIGIRLSEDTATLLSPAMIDEFILPYMEKAAKPFGGAFVHFCGKHEILYDKLLECDFVKAIDMGNPEMYDSFRLLEQCSKTGTIFYGKLAAYENETWKQYINRIMKILKDTGARCVLRPAIFPSGSDECAEMYDMWDM